MINALDVLKGRGLVQWCSDEAKLGELFASEIVTAYVGFDPSADSLHIGNMIPVMGLAWLQRLGHRPLALVGGGTGLIGDPSGKTKERQLLDLDQAQHNIQCIKAQLERFLDFGAAPNGALMKNNYDWLKDQSYIGFLRDTGKYFPVNYMINREYIRSRIDDPQKSITYTELSYMLLQAFDFDHMYSNWGVKLQMGGNDQQGNIIAGIDLIHKRSAGQAYGFTFPLLLTSSGQKFGKSEQGAIYLSPERTSCYRFYQFWMNTEDADMPKLLRLYTFWDEEEIRALLAEHEKSPERRAAQKKLAFDFTRRVHGQEMTEKAMLASEILFGSSFERNKLAALDESTIAAISLEVPYAEYGEALPASYVDILAKTGAAGSKSEARRLIKSGGFYCNGIKITSEEEKANQDDLLLEKYLFLRLGKKKFYLVKICR